MRDLTANRATAEALADEARAMGLEQKNLNLRFRGSENQRLIDVPKSLLTHEVVLWDV